MMDTEQRKGLTIILRIVQFGCCWVMVGCPTFYVFWAWMGVFFVCTCVIEGMKPKEE